MLSAPPERIGQAVVCPKCKKQGEVPAPPMAKTAAIPATLEEEWHKRQTIQVAPGRPFVYRVVGWIMIFLGFVLSLRYWLFFDTAEYNFQTYEVIHKQYLMNDRLIGTVVAVGLCMGGTIIVVSGCVLDKIRSWPK